MVVAVWGQKWLDRWQRTIEVDPTSSSLDGYVGSATADGQPLYALTGSTNEVPRIRISASQPLASASCLTVVADDPYRNLLTTSWAARLRGLPVVLRDGQAVHLSGGQVLAGGCP